MSRKGLAIYFALAVVAVIVLVNTVDLNTSQNLLKKQHKDSHHVLHPKIDPETFFKTPEELFKTMKVVKLSDKYSHKIIRHEDGSVDEDIDLYINDAWKDWKHLCKKSYESEEEEQRRFELWKKRFIKIEENNEEHHGFTGGEHCFMDLTAEEWAARAGGRLPNNDREEDSALTSEMLLHDQTLPQYVSWKGVVNLPIRNQKCGDCWANSATSAMEALWQILGNPYTEFAVQENIDCAYNKSRSGCDGGVESQAYKYAISYGAVPAKNDPYEGKYNSAETCQNDAKYKTDNKFFVTRSTYLGTGDCNAVKAALLKQPVSVGMDANSKFMSAKSEIVPFQAAGQLNHAVLLVGYTPDAWIIQNSWGQTNGYFGYYRLAMGNTLGICTDVSIPTSNQTYKLTPKTTAFDFLKEYGSANGAASAGINLMSFIGTKFSIWGGNYKVQLQNTKGETIKQIDHKYFYVPEGRDKTDFNFFRISFIFLDITTSKTFDMIFEAGPNGMLKSTNVKNKELFLGQCKTNDLGAACNGLDEKTIFIFSSDNTYVVRLNWHKP